eukprot:GHRR01003830.1.p1 GENE.GHRR01003830.1~~GHRR01003830.1.p1  ORF type:complete len:221 (+),score=96.88 GHRR01003830.1:72-734(+)
MALKRQLQRSTATRVHCQAAKNIAVAPIRQRPSSVQHLVNAAGTTALAVSLAVMPINAAQAASAPQQLADILREEYKFIDENNDGLVTKSEVQKLVKNISSENNVPLIDGDQLDFSMKLFDLNQDGKLTSEEVLRSLVLDGAVDEEAVDADVFSVFDNNKNESIEKEEFRKALGDLGSNGDAAKDFVFQRVDYLSGSNGHLNAGAFGTALVLMRSVLLGY